MVHKSRECNKNFVLKFEVNPLDYYFRAEEWTHVPDRNAVIASRRETDANQIINYIEYLLKDYLFLIRFYDEAGSLREGDGKVHS